MNFIKLTKMDDNFNKNVLSPLAPHIGSLFPTLRAIEPTFPTNIPHNAPKSGKPSPFLYLPGSLKAPYFNEHEPTLPITLPHESPVFYP